MISKLPRFGGTIWWPVRQGGSPQLSQKIEKIGVRLLFLIIITGDPGNRSLTPIMDPDYAQENTGDTDRNEQQAYPQPGLSKLLHLVKL